MRLRGARGWLCLLMSVGLSSCGGPEGTGRRPERATPDTNADETKGLIAHWPLMGDARDHTGHGHDAVNRGVRFEADGAVFDGRGAHLEVPDGQSLHLGTRSFSIAAWICTEKDTAGGLGDLVSKFDAATRSGLNLGVADHPGVTSAQANYRNLEFGIDAGTAPAWQDCGRPGNAVQVFALAVLDGRLYAGTYEHGAGEVGHVYRYRGEQEWEDCRIPTRANCVSSLVAHAGRLYAATGCYDSRGSAIGNPGNTTAESRILRLEPDGSWVDCGELPGEPDLPILGLYRGRLYATLHYRVALYRYEGGRSWRPCATPYPRFFALAQWRDHLYAAANLSLRRLGPPPDYERIFIPLPDADSVYRYDDRTDTWQGCGRIPGETQMYGFAVHRGALYVGTWPNAKVFRSATGIGWEDCGRLHPKEKEVMAMAVYNGMLYAGALPTADVYRYDGDGRWTRAGATDQTPNVTYRRAWSMAVHDGKLYVGTLPSGHVHAMQVGQAASDGRELAAGWQHVVAARDADRLRLYVNGELRAESPPSVRGTLDLTNEQPLRIGTGAHDYFRGRMADVRLYARALSAAEVSALLRRVPPPPP